MKTLQWETEVGGDAVGLLISAAVPFFGCLQRISVFCDQREIWVTHILNLPQQHDADITAVSPTFGTHIIPQTTECGLMEHCLAPQTQLSRG